MCTACDVRGESRERVDMTSQPEHPRCSLALHIRARSFTDPPLSGVVLSGHQKVISENTVIKIHNTVMFTKNDSNP